MADGLGLLQLSFHWEACVSIGNKTKWQTHIQKSLNSCNRLSPFKTQLLSLPSYTKEMRNYESSLWWKLHQSIRHRVTCVFKNITPENFNSVIYSTILSPMSLQQIKTVFSSKVKRSWRLLDSFTSYFESNRLVNAKRYFSIIFYIQLDAQCVFLILFTLEHDNSKNHMVLFSWLRKILIICQCRK
jgi:hypothetical protein